MVVKKPVFNKRITNETLMKFKLHPVLGLPKCKYCKNHNECNEYPCEVDYRSNGSIKCNKKIVVCSRCFNPDKVFVCDNHSKDINAVFCDFTGQCYSESPVYYYFPELGIRRVYDTECKGCGKVYQVCHHHDSSPIKYTKCAMCLKDMFDDFGKRFVYGLRDLKEDEFTL